MKILSFIIILIFCIFINSAFTKFYDIKEILRNSNLLEEEQKKKVSIKINKKIKKKINPLYGFWQSVEPEDNYVLEFKKNGNVFFTDYRHKIEITKKGEFKFIKFNGLPMLTIKFPEKKKYIRVYYNKKKRIIISGKNIFKPRFELWGLWEMEKNNLKIKLKIENFLRFTETIIKENDIKQRKGYCEIKKIRGIKYLKLNYDSSIPGQLYFKFDKAYNVILLDYKNRIFKQTSLY